MTLTVLLQRINALLRSHITMSASILEVQKHWNVKYTTTNAFFGHVYSNAKRNVIIAIVLMF